MITRKSFLSGDFKKKSVKRENNVVENFLKSHKRNAFEGKDIAKRVKRSSSVVFTHLRKLIKQKKVLRNKPFYMWR